MREDEVLLGPNERFLMVVCAEDISSAFESIVHEIIRHYAELTFFGDEFDMQGTVVSYLDRKSFVTERNSDLKLELIKTFLTQTSPQGSSMSPPWWRVFNGGYIRIYKEKLDEYVRTNRELIHGYTHVGYADDENTTFCIRIPKNLTVEETQVIIKRISADARRMLKEATGVFGCSVNDDKSEILIPQAFKDISDECKPKLKSEITWLGYSLANDDLYFKFTNTRMRTKFKTSLDKFEKCVQYIKSIKVRKRIYQVYLAPIANWFIPTVMSHKRRLNSPSDEVEKFQQTALSMVGNCKGRVSRVGLNRAMGEHSVEEKCYNMAKGLVKYFPRNIEQMRGSSLNTGAQTRSGLVARDRIWKNCDMSDFGDRVNFLLATGTPPFRKRFIPNKAHEWLARVNAAIRQRILDRQRLQPAAHPRFTVTGIPNSE